MDALTSVQVGLGAGLATSMLWVFTSLFFTAGGKRIGATSVNTIRLIAAVALHLVTFWLLTGAAWPEMSAGQFWALVASGLIGLTLCDQLLFTAFVYIGPRRSLLMMTTSPIWAVVLGVLFLREGLGWGELIGIVLIVAGVVMVILQRREPDQPAVPRHVRAGWILAALAACFQSTGMLFSKMGMGHGVGPDAQDLSPQAATLVRMCAGAAGMIPWLAFRWINRPRPVPGEAGDIPGSASAAMGGTEAEQEEAIGRPGPVEDEGVPAPRRVSLGIFFTLCGAVVGPYLGVWMSLVAVNKVDLGVAQTICSLSPVMILPIAMVFLRERIGWRGWVGATVAVGGTAVLFLNEQIGAWLGLGAGPG